MSTTERIMGIDPSSTCIGWACLDGRGELRACGKITPSVKHKTGVDGPEAYRRIFGLVNELDATIAEQRPTQVVVEVPSGKVGRRHGGSGAGLPIYGAAVGVVIEMVRQRHTASAAIALATEADWTARWTSKAARVRGVALRHPRYPRIAEEIGDRGMDIADAIGIADWWWSRRATQNVRSTA